MSTCISFVKFEHNGKDEPETEVQLNLNYKLELKEKNLQAGVLSYSIHTLNTLLPELWGLWCGMAGDQHRGYPHPQAPG